MCANERVYTVGVLLSERRCGCAVGVVVGCGVVDGQLLKLGGSCVLPLLLGSSGMRPAVGRDQVSGCRSPHHGLRQAIACPRVFSLLRSLSGWLIDTQQFRWPVQSDCLSSVSAL